MVPTADQNERRRIWARKPEGTSKRVLAAWTLLGMLAGAVVVVMIYASLTSANNSDAIAAKQARNIPKIDQTAETLRLVKDCVTPGGMCYQRSLAMTAHAIITLDQRTRAATAAAAACAATPGIQGYTAIKACVDKTLAKQAGEHP